MDGWMDGSYSCIYNSTYIYIYIYVLFKTRVGVFYQIKNARRSRAFYI